jgi:hypothetical protein
MKTTLLFSILFLLTFFNDASALEYNFNRYNYPTKNELGSLIKSDPVSLTICCSYPSKEDVSVLNSINLKALFINAGFFPSKEEIKLLDLLNTPYSIELSEVFPSSLHFSLMNNSNIKQLIINSKDFLTMGEVAAFNNFKIPTRININHSEYPLPRHMRVIKQLKPEIIVGFKNNVPPGPGYANFFNDLKNAKVFNIKKQFLYGDDHIGINLLTRSSIELSPDEYIRPQDIRSINNIKLNKNLFLGDQRPYTKETINLIKSIEAESVNIVIFEESLLSNETVEAFRDAKSNIIINQ